MPRKASKKPPRHTQSGSASQEVRIIGGIHKGRKLRFRGGADLRPTMGRTRETLFNWLRPHLPGAHCLDLFAGSGVLGFEALSQGAQSIMFVEQDRRAHAALQENIALLGAKDVIEKASMQSWLGDARRYLKNPPTALRSDSGDDLEGDAKPPRGHNPFDIIFIDPPFRHTELIHDVLKLIAAGGWARRYVYVEARDTQAIVEQCGDYDLEVVRKTRTGDAQAVLLERSAPIAGPPAN